MPDDDSTDLPWPTPEDYGARYRQLNEQLERSFALSEYRGASQEDTAILRYRLAKLAIAAEDLRRAISILENESATDERVAEALTELRGACMEICESFAEADEHIIRFMNFLDV